MCAVNRRIVAGLSAAFALLVWGVTFASTRALLVDFSVLEIMVVRFALAWAVLWRLEAGRRSRGMLQQGRRAVNKAAAGQ